MREIFIDFSRKHFRYRTTRLRISIAMASMYVIGLTSLTAITSSCLDFKKSVDAQHVQIQDLRSRLNVPEPRQAPVDVQVSLAKVRAQNAAIQKLNLPWSDLLKTIEQVTPQNVALLSLEPDAGRSTLILVAESANSDAMLDYVSRLKEQRLFSDVRLVMHEVNKQDPYAPYRFQVEARWQDGGL